MKKTLLALAVVAASGAAFAQSATISGTVNYGYQQVSSAGSADVAANSQKGFALDTVTLNVGVTEDLGGGLKAAANVTFDGASANFAQPLNRRNASIGLSGGFGSVTLSNTRSSDLLTKAMVAPSNLPDGMYDSSGILARAPIDAITYSTPAMSGFTGSLSFIESGTDGTTTATSNTLVLGGSYAAGPITAGLVYKMQTKVASGEKVKNLEAFATYDLGVAKLGVGFDQKPTGGDHAFSVGVSAPLGAATVGVNFAKRGANKVTEFAAKYDLSKRTNVNFSAGKQTIDLGNQYRLSVQHNF
jgi:Gram-negative porin